MTSGPHDWRSIAVLNAVSTIAQVGQFGIPFMVLPLWLEQHGASNLELSLFASSLWVGQLPGMHWAPRMTDRFGAKRIILAALLSTVLALALLAVGIPELWRHRAAAARASACRAQRAFHDAAAPASAGC